MDNSVEGAFFLPVLNKFKLLIGGTGESCLVKAFYGKYMRLEMDDDTLLTSERRNCECCKII